MKKWEGYLVAGIASLIIAFVLLAWCFQSLHESLELARLTGEFDPFFFGPLVFGVLLLGFGVAYLSVVHDFYKIEKER